MKASNKLTLFLVVALRLLVEGSALEADPLVAGDLVRMSASQSDENLVLIREKRLTKHAVSIAPDGLANELAGQLGDDAGTPRKTMRSARRAKRAVVVEPGGRTLVSASHFDDVSVPTRMVSGRPDNLKASVKALIRQKRDAKHAVVVEPSGDPTDTTKTANAATAAAITTTTTTIVMTTTTTTTDTTIPAISRPIDALIDRAMRKHEARIDAAFDKSLNEKDKTTHDLTWGPDGSLKHCRPSNGTGVHKRTRKEVHAWSDEEWEVFHGAVTQLKQQGFWVDMVYKHVMSDEAHSHDEFLPFHRAFLEELETALQRVANDCSLTLPWWNWAAEAGSILTSTVWSPNRYGTLRRGCIQDGIAANWTNYKGECVWRRPSRLDRDLPVRLSWPFVYQEMGTKTTYAEMRRSLEFSIHNWFHCAIGGTMCSFESPDDPAFYLHHAFIDFAWFAWQRDHPNASDTCGQCNLLADFSNAPAGTYVGQYSSSPNDCVLYPPSNPRICLAYTMSSSIQRTGDMLGEMQPSPCQKLMDQVSKGQCSHSDLARIKGIAECVDGNSEFIEEKLAEEWLVKVAMHHGGHQQQRDSWDRVKSEIHTFWENVRKHQQVSAKTEEERSACVACDFECTGAKP